MRRTLGRLMNDPGSALSVDGLMGLDAETRPKETAWSEDSALVDRCLAGDDAAFDALVQKYQDMVFNLSYRLLRDYEEADDLSQEVFIQVYRKLGSFRRAASLRTWIYRIVFNRAKNRQRWWKRRLLEMTAMSLDDVERNPSVAVDVRIRPAPVGPDRALEEKEVSEILLEAIEKLPFSHRTIVLLKDVEGLSYDEIAATLELPLGTVKSRLARARQALRKQLDPSFFGFLKEV